MKLRRNDLVEVISGNEKGKRGRVLRVMPGENLVLIQGVNLRYKHVRRSQRSPQGGRIQKEAPLDVSNVMIVDPESGEPTRVGVRFAVEGKRRGKVRYAKRSGAEIPASGE